MPILKRILSLSLIVFSACLYPQIISSPTPVSILSPYVTNYSLSGSSLKGIDIDITTSAVYANLSIYIGGTLVVDNIDVPSSGSYSLNALVYIFSNGDGTLKLQAKGGDITINTLDIYDASVLDFPEFIDITSNAGLVSAPSTKYGGPSIADMDMDGDYDMILNNHNDESSQLYWNNGDGTVTEHSVGLAQWFMQDLHGSAAGDYDNDGDLDLLLARGGGNGTTPQPPVFYRNDNGTLVDAGAAVGLVYGARGRSAAWMDLDLDGDLDLSLCNAGGVNYNGHQHLFYRNEGNGQLTVTNMQGIGLAGGDRMLVTDFNNDNIDDILLYPYLKLWQGNGDFTFTDVTSQLPGSVTGIYYILSATDIDIDNDGDLDIYITGGKGYFEMANRALDFDPVTMELNLKDTAWDAGGDPADILMDLYSAGPITIMEFEFSAISHLYGGDFPIYMGSTSNSWPVSNIIIDNTDILVISTNMAYGWPTNRGSNGLYIGYLSNDLWRIEAVKRSNLSWGVAWTMDNISNTSYGFALNNRNHRDILLRNDNGSFADVSAQWNIPQGGNHWGVTRGDFNNDSYQDLFIFRYGYLKSRIQDYMLLNTGQDSFEITTVHNATDRGTVSHGDGGQAFDFDLDGSVDILSGSDERGMWYLYKNQKTDANNWSIVRVGYSPTANVDPISALVIISAGGQEYRQRVGSGGGNFSQSLHNNVHFGLGGTGSIDSVTIRWRNGETIIFNNPAANTIIDTDNWTPPPSVTNYTGELKPVLGPNPVNRDSAGGVLLKYLTPTAKVKIYNLAEDLVKELSGVTPDGLMFWNLKNDEDFLVAEGLYILHITDDEGAESFLKLTVSN